MTKGTPSAETVGTVFDRLTNDQDFREQMLGDPVSALKPYGIDVDPQQLPVVRKLPSKDALAQARSQILGDPMGNVGIFIFLLK
ncbi:MAG: NHLP-related RiPP peptide [Dokdonella sp.]